MRLLASRCAPRSTPCCCTTTVHSGHTRRGRKRGCEHKATWRVDSSPRVHSGTAALTCVLSCAARLCVGCWLLVQATSGVPDAMTVEGSPPHAANIRFARASWPIVNWLLGEVDFSQLSRFLCVSHTASLQSTKQLQQQHDHGIIGTGYKGDLKHVADVCDRLLDNEKKLKST